MNLLIQQYLKFEVFMHINVKNSGALPSFGVHSEIHEYVLDDLNNISLSVKINQKKCENVKFAEYLSDIDHKYSQKILMCASAYYTDVYQHYFSHDVRVKVETFFCKDRFCPVCSYLKKLQNRYNLTMALDYFIQRQNAYNCYFMTLTTKNCTIDKLRNTIRRLNRSFNNFKKSRIFHADYWRYYVRYLEVTYNEEEKTYHPHLHILILTPVRYGFFSDITVLFSAWTHSSSLSGLVSTNLDYQKISKSNFNDIIRELSKYIVKADMCFSDVLEFREQMMGVRQYSYSRPLLEKMKSHIRDTDEMLDLSDYVYIYSVLKKFNFFTDQYDETFESRLERSNDRSQYSLIKHDTVYRYNTAIHSKYVVSDGVKYFV